MFLKVFTTLKSRSSQVKEVQGQANAIFELFSSIWIYTWLIRREKMKISGLKIFFLVQFVAANPNYDSSNVFRNSLFDGDKFWYVIYHMFYLMTWNLNKTHVRASRLQKLFSMELAIMFSQRNSNIWLEASSMQVISVKLPDDIQISRIGNWMDQT